jgi:hypothetical protein
MGQVTSGFNGGRAGSIISVLVAATRWILQNGEGEAVISAQERW